MTADFEKKQQIHIVLFKV